LVLKVPQLLVDTLAHVEQLLSKIRAELKFEEAQRLDALSLAFQPITSI